LRRQQALQRYVEKLRQTAGVVILLSPPRVDLATRATRLRGDPAAPVVITEFGDFECPFCVKVQATIRELLKKYDRKVALAFRDYPLTQIHPHAQAAAEAARCAEEQGKFW
jgi:protein-disulfide isomerase